MFSSNFRSSRCAALLLSSALLVVACDGQPDEVLDPDEASTTILHDLGLPSTFAIVPTTEDGSGSFAVAVGAGESGDGAEFELSINSGSFELWAARGEILMLQALEVEIENVELPSDVFTPEGAALTGLRASLRAPVTLDVSDDHEHLGAIAELDLRAEWTLELPDGTAYEMSALRLDDVPFALDIERDESGELSARVVAFRQGTFWRWADRFQLSDLVVDLVAGL